MSARASGYLMPYRYDPPPSTVVEALLLSNAEDLKRLMNTLPVPRPRPTRKADMAKAIEGYLHGSSLRTIWETLGEHQQLAVRETLHGFGGEFDPERFKAKYGKLPKDYEGSSSSQPSPLNFFLYPKERYRQSPSIVPPDLEKRLKDFVSPPPEPKLCAVEELPDTVQQRRRGYCPSGQKFGFEPMELVRRDMEQAAAHDLLAVLRLVEQGRVAVSVKTRRATAAAMRRIAEVLHGDDFFDAAEKKPDRWSQVPGPIRAFAWPWLLQAGRLAELHGSKLALTKRGRAALAEAPAKTLRYLWERWLKNTLLDEFSRVDTIKGQHGGKGKRSLTAAAGRRLDVAFALAECPVGKWIGFDDFSRFMRAADYDFIVTRDPWRLYLGEPRHGSLGYAGNHDWDILQGRYVLSVLFEYAATLGMIDVAYTHPDGARPDFTKNGGADDLAYLSRYDGLRYFRLNPLGAYCLGEVDAYEPTLPPPAVRLTVFPDLRMRVEGTLPSHEHLLLETVANPESDDAWRLEPSRILAAMENGYQVQELREFLSARDDQPLPETVEGFLRNLERGEHALKSRDAALLIECADKDIAARLAADRKTAPLCLPAGERHVVVRAKDEKRFRKAVHGLGYGMPRA